MPPLKNLLNHPPFGRLRVIHLCSFYHHLNKGKSLEETVRYFQQKGENK